MSKEGYNLGGGGERCRGNIAMGEILVVFGSYSDSHGFVYTGGFYASHKLPHGIQRILSDLQLQLRNNMRR